MHIHVSMYEHIYTYACIYMNVYVFIYLHFMYVHLCRLRGENLVIFRGYFRISSHEYMYTYKYIPTCTYTPSPPVK